MNDIILGLSTNIVGSTVNIIRLSGKGSLKLVNEIFSGNNLEEIESHTINFGYIVKDNEKIDQVLVSVMKAPKTYTKEDVVEINCHGGVFVTNKIVEILLGLGARMAEPGEFTKRAFLNGRISLIEAEAVSDIINARTEISLKNALNEINGKGTNLIKKLKEKILEIIANIEVNIDYPEYEDIEQITNEKLTNNLKYIKEEISSIINVSKNNRLIKSGIDTIIIGKPNVGKSSLLNELLEEEKAIVSDIEGTTRDVVEGKINIGNLELNLMDTAGIRETNNYIEQKGIEKTYNLIEKAELIILILDISKEMTQEEIKIIEEIKDKNHLIILNKSDLEQKNKITGENVFKISTTKKTGIEELKNYILDLYEVGKLEESENKYINSARAINILKEIDQLIDSIIINNEQGVPVSIIEIDLKEIWNKLGSIIGETFENDLIDHLFSNFCLGK